MSSDNLFSLYKSFNITNDSFKMIIKITMFTKAFYQQVNNELFMMKVMKSPKHIDFTIQKKKYQLPV